MLIRNMRRNARVREFSQGKSIFFKIYPWFYFCHVQDTFYFDLISKYNLVVFLLKHFNYAQKNKFFKNKLMLDSLHFNTLEPPFNLNTPKKFIPSPYLFMKQ